MRISKRTTILAALALLAAAALTGLASAGSDVDPDGGSGLIATATARDLSTTESITGTLARAETSTIVYGGIGNGSGGLRLAALATPVPADGSSPAAGDADSPDAEACPSPTPSPAATPSAMPSPGASPTADPTPCPSSTPTPSPTPRPSPTPTPTRPPSPTPPSYPVPDSSPLRPSQPQAPAPPDPEASVGSTGQMPAGSNRAIPDGNAGGLDGTAAPQARAVTLTSVIEVGAVADRGSVLYAADSEPVAVLIAAEALFRDLSTGSTDGDDVLALEENLARLGYGANLTVDRHFDGETASAVGEWEEDLGRNEPDGIVSVGEVVFIPEPAVVISRRAVVGDKLTIGTPVLSLGTRSRVVAAKVDVADRNNWAADTVVRLDWAGQSGTGTVTEVGRDEVDGQLEVTISLGPDAPDLPIGTEVEATVTTADHSGVVTVPVAAIVDASDGPGVRTAGGDGDKVTPVKLGIVSGGLVEITEGLAAGTKVRLPG